jgi:hypothetical protein
MAFFVGKSTLGQGTKGLDSGTISIVESPGSDVRIGEALQETRGEERYYKLYLRRENQPVSEVVPGEFVIAGQEFKQVR